MAILLPNLDDRRWVDLVEQGRALIPLYAPEWTDHNASDPGVTLMELLAWVAEMDVYQLNRITERQKRRLLQLLDIRPEPPRPATLVAELRISAGSSPIALPQSLEYTASRLDGSAELLQSTTGVVVSATELRAIQRRDASGFYNLTAPWMRGDTLPMLGESPETGAEFYLGFDRPLPPGVWTQLYFRLGSRKASLDERRRLLDENGATTLPRHHSARVVWEYLGGADQWLPLDTEDDTRSLTLTGAVRVRPGGAMHLRTVGQVVKPYYYVRAGFTGGAFDEAPRVERLLAHAVELRQAVPVCQTWPIAPGVIASGTPIVGQPATLQLQFQQGAISMLAFDPPAADPAFVVLGYTPATAMVAGSLTVQAALVGSGTGEPEQRLTVPQRPLVEQSFRLFSLEEGSWRRWERVDDCVASRRSSPHFMLDATRGDLTFGDGEAGRAPRAGSLLFATYDATHAEAGAGHVSGIADSPRNRVLLTDPSVRPKVTAVQEIVLDAGAGAETLAHALGRAIESREARLRAVTAEDIEAIALDTPGTSFARAIARPNLYFGLDCVSAPGVVTVVVVPWLPAGRPMPSAGLIARVRARLESRRMLGTRIIVTGPGYLEVAVRARVKALDGTDRARVRRDVADALNRFFDPLTGGPDQSGWPLGRDVFRAEVMQAIDDTSGVDHVLSLEISADGCAPTCGNVCLRPTSLVAAGTHEIEVV